MESSIFPLARAQLEAGTFDWTAGTIRAVMLPPGVVIDYTEEYLQDIPAGSRIAISADIEERAVNGGWFAGNPVSFGVVLDTRLVSQVVLFLDTGNEATSLLIAHLGDDGIIGDPFAPMGVEYFLYPDATFGGFFFFAAVSELEVTIETVAPMPELRWTAVTSDVLTLLGYHVFRSIDGEPFTELAALNPATLTFTDDSELPSDVVIRYYVEARLDISAIEPDPGYFAVSSDTVGFGAGPPLLLGSPPVGAALNETCVGAALQTQNLAGTVVWSIVGGALPDGWSLDTATGAVGGVATKEGSFTYTLRATGTDPVSGDAAYVEGEFTTTIGRVVVLLHFDGADGSTTFTDETGRAWSSGGGTPTISTSQSVFGGSSLSDPNSDSCISTASHADLGFGTGDFTIDLWIRPSSLAFGAKSFYDHRTSLTQNRPTLYLDSNLLRYYVAGANRIGGNALALNTWYHIAVTRAGGTTRLFTNGTLIGTWADTTNYETSRLLLGEAGDNEANGFGFSGFIDEVRVTKGAARWTENFTPPAAPSDFPVA